MAATMTGEQISAIAYQLEPLTPKGLGPAVEFIAIVFGIVCVIVVGLRIYVRAGLSGASTRLWGVEDWLAVIGTLYLIRASEYQTYWEVLYFISSTIIKCAIGFTCVRLDRRKRVTVIMGINMAVMVIVAILALVFVFANCTPLAATWNPALGTCQKVISLQTVSYIVSAIQMITDWTCAIIPFFIVAGLQMSQRKKVSVCAILGLGLFASIATVIRMPYLKYYDTAKYPTEIGYHLGVISITSNLECALGIIGCSLPPLRKLFKFYYGSSHDGNYKVSGGSENVLGSAGPAIKLGSLSDHDRTYHASARRTGTRDLETDDDRDDSSHKGIIRKTDVYISTSSFKGR
ncbi:hypothetical protein COL26b_004912 [Colletotrichum chrysophilum]|uniref:uncharacterized protein n=1 Tax=Colletotrichum chrysophilum TaxID=1836956 RepID=UPI0022FFE7E9|nr:uncharacterized protein COL26b_004912 [Colletotrichum chrysophilum]KAJ0376859.1 hypothetical protein COL26b_004912 [Colletotrichum chrysophilum]